MSKIKISDVYYLQYNNLFLHTCNTFYCAEHKGYIENGLKTIKDELHNIILNSKNKNIDGLINKYAKLIKDLLKSKKGIESQKCSLKYCSSQVKSSLSASIDVVLNITHDSININIQKLNDYSKKIKKEKNEKYLKMYKDKIKTTIINIKKTKKVHDKMLNYQKIIKTKKLTVDDIITIKIDMIRHFMKNI
jgi:hypothetical protein